MRSWLKILIPIVAIGIVAAAIYAELVLDIRAPRSNLTVFASLAGSSSFLISDVNRRSKELNQRFGNGAKTKIATGGELITRIDGKVVKPLPLLRGEHGGNVQSDRRDNSGPVSVILIPEC